MCWLRRSAAHEHMHMKFDTVHALSVCVCACVCQDMGSCGVCAVQMKLSA